MEPKRFYLTSFFLISGVIAVSAQGLCPTVQAIRENSVNSKIRCSIPNVQGLRTWKLGSSGKFVDIDQDKFQVEPDGVLIKNAGSNDLILKIEIENPITGTVIRSAVITVVIYAPPKIKDLQSINDLNDEYAHISCIASGKPTPQVYWAFESNNGDSRDLYDFTQFLDQSTKDLWSTIRATESGTYYCRATSGYGSDIKQIRVQLNVATKSPETTGRWHVTTETSTIDDRRTTIDETSTTDDRATTIHETSTNYDMSTTIDETSTIDDRATTIRDTSTIDDRATTIDETSTNYDISTTIDETSTIDDRATTIRETSTIDDSATTIDETSTIDDRATTIDEVLIAKPTIRAREILTNTSNEALGCVATGYPLPKIVWYYENHRIKANRTYLVKERVSSYVEQSTYGLGIYTCYAINPFGTSSDSIQVAPLINVSHTVPVKVVAIKSFVLVPGSNEIQCLATGNPLPTINWVLETDFIREKIDIKSANAVASYINVNESSVGQYKCLASNSITLMIAHVNVMQSRNEYYPAIARVFNTTVYIEDEEALGCIATGNPRPTIVWSKDNQELFTKEELYDDDRQEVTSYLSIVNGTGTYSCLVFNQLNSHRPCLEIKVLHK